MKESKHTITMEDSLPSFELVHDTIICLKNNFLREILLDVLGDGEDKSLIECVGTLAMHFLTKQKKESDEFWEKVKRAEVTVEEHFEFQYNRYNSVYCLVCLEEIKKMMKLLNVILAKLCFMKNVFKKEIILKIVVLFATENKYIYK